MSLIAGTRLGNYEILEVIGSGGMGEVYKARDPRLNRSVAIKVLLDHVSAAPDARARFEREAQTIAGLNHPHICVVHDVGRHEKTDFLVMEYLDGETLARGLERGPLPLDQALKCAMEIADALDRAHQHGITHRDLKPGNIMLTPGGVKLLDFGLAKLRTQGISGLSEAATKADITAEGTIIGSLQYMAPEQLEGSEADARTDIFAFGAVLYEMVTGRRAFEGKSAVSLMSAILKDTPKPVTALQSVAPEALDEAIEVCLAKSPEDRWQSARDLRRELKRISENVGKSGRESHSRRSSSFPMTATLVAAGIVLTVLAAWAFRSSPANGPQQIARLAVTLEPGEELQSLLGPPVAISPDGSLLAFASVRRGLPPLLYLRAIDDAEAKTVPGSEGASNPFFSANGQWVAFFSSGKLKKVAVAGGAVETIGDSAGIGSGSWGDDDTIYFATPYGLRKVPAAGGMAQTVTTLDRAKGEVSHRWPQVLPGGKALLLTVWTGPGWDETNLQVLDLKSSVRRVVVRGTRNGYYVPSGHIVYFRQGTDTLMAMPFDLDSLQVADSPPVTLKERVRDTSEGGEYAVSNAGVLAYVASAPQMYESRMVWVSRDGTIDPLPARAQGYQEPVISPDGRQVAISVAGPVFSISIYDLGRDTLTSLTASGSSQAPVWTDSGKKIVYRATRKGSRNLFERNADGSGEEKRLTTAEDTQTPASVSLDGSKVAFSSGGDIWMLTLGVNPKSEAIYKSPFSERNIHQSLDGRWLAYVSDESGVSEIYVRPNSAVDAKWKVSADGGSEPVWSRDSRELFYRSGDKMMVVTVRRDPSSLLRLPKWFSKGDTNSAGPPYPDMTYRPMAAASSWFSRPRLPSPPHRSTSS